MLSLWKAFINQIGIFLLKILRHKKKFLNIFYSRFYFLKHILNLVEWRKFLRGFMKYLRLYWWKCPGPLFRGPKQPLSSRGCIKKTDNWVQWYSVPDRCVLDPKFLDVASLGQSFPWLFCPWPNHPIPKFWFFNLSDYYFRLSLWVWLTLC